MYFYQYVERLAKEFNPCSLHFYIREYLERQAKAEAFKAGEEEIEEAIEAVENAGEKLKATAEDAKKSVEERIGSNGDAGLLPTVYLVMLLPKLMMQGDGNFHCDTLFRMALTSIKLEVRPMTHLDYWVMVP